MPRKLADRAWMIWAFIPWLCGISLVVAGIKAKEKRWWIVGLLLLIPTIPGFALSDSEGTDIYDVAVGFAVAAWLVAVTYVWRVRPKYELRMTQLYPEKYPSRPPRRAEAPYAGGLEPPPISEPSRPPADTSQSHRRPAADTAMTAPSPSGAPPPVPVAPIHTERDVPQTGLADSLIDLSRATATELAALPGVTAELAQRAVGYREGRGGYRDFSDFVDAVGLQPKQAEILRSRVVVSRPAQTPAD